MGRGISWEGGKSRLASPETGLEAKEQEMLRAAHRNNIEQQPRSCSVFPTHAFPEF